MRIASCARPRWPTFVAAVAFGLAASLAGEAASHRNDVIPARFRGVEVSTLPTKARVVALTFDAGSNAVAFSDLVSTLRRERVAATFFLTGRWVRTYPKLAASVGRSFELGNHTYSHPSLIRLDTPTVRNEIVSAASWIRSGTGHNPRPLFRFPYGDSDARTIGIANDLGYVCVRWTIDTLGWEPSQTADGVVAQVLRGLKPGAIILLHVGAPSGAPTDTRALPALIRELRARGYGFVKLRARLGI